MWVAQGMTGMMTWHHPHHPPAYHQQPVKGSKRNDDNYTWWLSLCLRSQRHPCPYLPIVFSKLKNRRCIIAENSLWVTPSKHPKVEKVKMKMQKHPLVSCLCWVRYDIEVYLWDTAKVNKWCFGPCFVYPEGRYVTALRVWVWWVLKVPMLHRLHYFTWSFTFDPIDQVPSTIYRIVK